MFTFIYFLTFFILLYFLLLSVGYTILMLFSFRDTYGSFIEAEYTHSTLLINQQQLIPLTVIIPSFNAEKIILDTIDSVLDSDYKNLNCLIVNDASTDNTMMILKKKFDLYEHPLKMNPQISTKPIIATYVSRSHPNVYVIDKEHSGSSDSINAGLNFCQTPLFITLDSDTVLQPESISNLVFGYLSHGHTVAVGGAMFILNACEVEKGRVIKKIIPKDFLASQQFCEYLRSFIYGRGGWEQFGGTLCYPGAFSLFETQAIFEVGGYDVHNYSYDANIIMKLHAYHYEHKKPYQIHFSPNAFAWTTGPSTLKGFWKQRNHWQRGMLRSSMQHIHMLFNPKYGRVGWFNYPYYLFFEVLGPVVEFVSYFIFLISWSLGIAQSEALVYFFILACVFNTFLTLFCIFLNAITFHTFNKILYFFKLLPITLVQMFGYRQLNAFCCTVATIQYMFNRLMKKPQ